MSLEKPTGSRQEGIKKARRRTGRIGTGNFKRLPPLPRHRGIHGFSGGFLRRVI
jgi:hypothetical protein